MVIVIMHFDCDLHFTTSSFIVQKFCILKLGMWKLYANEVRVGFIYILLLLVYKLQIQRLTHFILSINMSYTEFSSGCRYWSPGFPCLTYKLCCFVCCLNVT